MKNVSENLSTIVDVAGGKVLRNKVRKSHQQLSVDVRFEVNAGYHFFFNQSFLYLVWLHVTGGYMRL